VAAVVTVNEGRLRKKNEADLAFSSLARPQPGRFEVLEDIGSICDAALLFPLL
jgi:hypothetical protein